MINPALSAALSTRHLVDALDRGDITRISLALANEAVWRTSLGTNLFRRQGRRILEEARQLACEDGEAYSTAWADMAEGMVYWHTGRWQDAVSYLQNALDGYHRRCTGVFFEIGLANIYLFSSLALAGRLEQLASLVRSASQRNRTRGDLFSLHGCLMGESVLGRLAEDAPDEAIAQAEEAIASWPGGDFLMQHYHHLITMVQSELYVGRVVQAHERIEAVWPAMARSGFLRVECAAAGLWFLRGRAALACAQADRLRCSAAIQVATRCRRALCKTRLPFARGFCETLDAGIAASSGRADLYKQHVESARLRFTSCQMPMHAAAVYAGANCHRALLSGADLQATTSGEQMTSGIEQFSTQSCRNWPKLAWTLAPIGDYPG